MISALAGGPFVSYSPANEILKEFGDFLKIADAMLILRGR
jgi:hypothetical protein